MLVAGSVALVLGMFLDSAMPSSAGFLGHVLLFLLLELGFRIWGLGFRVWGLGFKVWGLGLQLIPG